MFRMSCFAGTLGGFVAPLCCTSAGYMPMYAASLVKHGSVYECIYIYIFRISANQARNSKPLREVSISCDSFSCISRSRRQEVEGFEF